MSEITIVYIETDGGEATTEETTWTNEYLPRIGERVFVAAAERRVVDVKHFRDSVTVTAMSKEDYHYVSNTMQEKMKHVFNENLLDEVY